MGGGSARHSGGFCGRFLGDKPNEIGEEGGIGIGMVAGVWRPCGFKKFFF